MKELGRIVINPYGEERPIYSPLSERTTPPENVIIFPDKKEHHIDWRLNLHHIGEIAKVIEDAEIVQEEGTFRVPLTNPKVPFAMGLIFADGHIGSYTTDSQLIIDLMDTVLTTPNSFLVDAGDTFDNGIWGGLQFEQVLPPYMQTFTVEDMMRELGERYAACVIGNHPEWLFTSAGQKPEMMFAQKMKGPVFPGMGLLHLQVGQQQYDWAIAHNYWGKSKINIHNTCVRLRENEYPQADVFTVAHEHIWGYMKEMVNGREVLYTRPGTAKLRDRYARIHGIAKRGQQCGLAVIFGAEKREFNAYTINDAVSLMKLREEIAQSY